MEYEDGVVKLLSDGSQKDTPDIMYNI